MIRTDRLALDTDTFAAERRTVFTDAMTRMATPVHYSLMRFGLPRWDEHIVVAALDIFDTTARAEVDEWSQVLDDMRSEFERELRAALEKTKSASDTSRQEATLARWVSQMAVNAATEAATTADPDGGVGLEWVTMEDPDVRHSHQDAHGQTVPTGHAFQIGDVEMLYPGQPVGDPANWINCRCAVRPTMLTEASAGTQVFNSGTADGDNPVEETKHTSSVIVALPAEDDPVHALGEEESHVTLVWLGDAVDHDAGLLHDELTAYAAGFSGEPLTDTVSGTAVLGKDKANVLLLDAQHLSEIRNGLMELGIVREWHDAAEQFPAWIPHLTIGYPDEPEIPTSDQPFSPDAAPVPEGITFDRIALWHGDERTEYRLGGTGVKTDDHDFATKQVIDEMVDIVTMAAEIPGTKDAEVVDGGEPDEPPMLDDDEVDIPVPWHGVLAPEGVPSGDGRQFAVESLTNRALPLPLKYMPADAAGHDGSVVCGRIDKIWREDGVIKAEGVFDHSEWGYESIRQIAEGMIRGVSVDVDQVVAAVDDPMDEAAGLMEFSAARIAAATLCAIPAFAEAFVALGPWQDIKEEDVETEDMDAVAAGETAEFKRVPQKTKDGPGWITAPKPTHRITDYWVDGTGAASIGWGAPGDFNRCRVKLAKYVQNPQWLAGLCANLHYRALGIWPGQEAGKAKAAASTESASLTASVSFAPSEEIVMPADAFRDPQLEAETALTITEDGRVFGHLASWQVCHIGIGEACVNAPFSQTDYAYFLTGRVMTDAGLVPVGQISLGGGHASMGKGLRAAVSHYDSTSTAVADVTVGEDKFGIWVAGVLRPGVTAEQVYALRAAVLSGDWREVIVGGQSNLELVAALAVNVPGFPLPRPALAASGGEQTSLVAASVVVGEKPVIDSERVAEVIAARSQIKSFRVQNARKLMESGRK